MTDEQPKQDEKADAEDVEEQWIKVGRRSDQGEGSGGGSSSDDDEGGSEVEEQGARYH